MVNIKKHDGPVIGNVYDLLVQIGVDGSSDGLGFPHFSILHLGEKNIGREKAVELSLLVLVGLFLRVVK